jgi:hypothetical protein
MVVFRIYVRSGGTSAGEVTDEERTTLNICTVTHMAVGGAR